MSTGIRHKQQALCNIYRQLKPTHGSSVASKKETYLAAVPEAPTTDIAIKTLTEGTSFQTITA